MISFIRGIQKKKKQQQLNVDTENRSGATRGGGEGGANGGRGQKAQTSSYETQESWAVTCHTGTVVNNAVLCAWTLLRT